MRAVCCNAVIHHDVLLLEISDCSENTDIPYNMATFLKKCYEDKKIKPQFETYLELLSPQRRPMANYFVKQYDQILFQNFVYWLFIVIDTCRNRLFSSTFFGFER